MVKLEKGEISNLKTLARDINKLVKAIDMNNNGYDIDYVLDDLVYLDVDCNDMIDCIADIQKRIKE